MVVLTPGVCLKTSLSVPPDNVLDEVDPVGWPPPIATVLCDTEGTDGSRGYVAENPVLGPVLGKGTNLSCVSGCVIPGDDVDGLASTPDTGPGDGRVLTAEYGFRVGMTGSG